MKMKQGVFLQALKDDATEATINIVGVIGWEVAYQQLKDMIRSIPETVERVIFEIYSPGGDVWDGNGIVQEIGAMKQTTVARVQVAASMATLIAVACDERSIAANGRFLIHNAWTVTQGDAEAHETRAKELRDCENEAVKFYAGRTGKDETEIRELMNKETWLTPKEALEWGFVTAIEDPFAPDDYKAVRDEIRSEGKWPVALAEIPEMEKTDDDETTGRTKVDEKSGTNNSNLQDEAIKAIEAAKIKGFEEGQRAVNEKLQARADAAEALVLQLKADTVELSAKLDASTTEARKLQSERDQARATVEKNTVVIGEMNDKITRLLSGGLSFSPSVETWEQALANCGNDYEKARKQFPDVYRTQRELDKQSAGQ